MKRYIHLLSALLIALVFLTACQSPQKSTPKEAQSQVQKESIDAIWNTWDETLKENYNNIFFEEQIQCEKPQEVAVYQMEQASNIDQKAEKIRKEYVPDKEFDKKYYKEDPNTVPPGPEYVNPKTGRVFILGDNGFINYSRSSEETKYVDEEDKIEKTVFVNRPYKDEEIVLKDGKITLSKAIDMAQKEENKWKKLSGDACDARAKKIEILPAADGGDAQAVKIYFEKHYKGVGILTDQRTTETSQDKPLSVEYVPCFDDALIVTSVQRVENFVSNMGAVHQKTVVRKLDQIVSLKSAIQIMEKELASYHDFKISHIELCYRYVNKITKRNDAGTLYTTSPCWVFYINEEPYKEEFVLVDCETGKLDYIKNY